MAGSRRFAVAAAALLAACASTRTSIETTWVDDTYSGAAFGRVAVLGMFDSEAESRNVEQSAATALSERGIGVIQAHRFLKPDLDYTQEQMQDELAAAAADGLLIFRLIAVDERQVYRQPEPYLRSIPLGVMGGGAPYYWYYYPHANYYWHWRATRDVVGSPGYWEEHTYVVVESSLYDTRTDQLVWTAKSETLDGTQFEILADSLVATIANRLDAIGLIGPEDGAQVAALTADPSNISGRSPNFAVTPFPRGGARADSAIP